MTTLIATKGLPGSGKSTWAAQRQADDPSSWRIVCRDDIRLICGARYEDDDEKVVAKIRDEMITCWLRAGFNVICSDTNLSPRVLRRLGDLATAADAGFIIEDFTWVPLETCLERNDDRWEAGDCKVPNSAIVRMHKQFLKSGAQT